MAVPLRAAVTRARTASFFSLILAFFSSGESFGLPDAAGPRPMLIAGLTLALMMMGPLSLGGGLDEAVAAASARARVTSTMPPCRAACRIDCDIVVPPWEDSTAWRARVGRCVGGATLA